MENDESLIKRNQQTGREEKRERIKVRLNCLVGHSNHHMK